MKLNSVLLCAVLIAASMSFVGCAPSMKVPRGASAEVQEAHVNQFKLAIDLYLERAKRVNDLAWPIFVANQSLCGKHEGYGVGLTMITARVLPRHLWETAMDEFDMRMRPSIATIAKGSPAEIAGLKVGDVVHSIDDRPTNTRVSAVTDAHSSLRYSLRDGDMVEFEIERNGKESREQILVAPLPACNSFAHTLLDRTVNAFANGRDVFILTGLVEFADEDEDLQLVISHELAHNSLAHVRKSTGNRVLGSIADLLAGSQGINTGGMFGVIGGISYSKDFEREADYVGLYMMARADIPTKNAADIWNRMAAEMPMSSRGTIIRTHPITGERYVNLQKAHAEIEEKIRNGLPLIPGS